MKAIVVNEAGGVDKLVLREVPIPELKPGWSLVKVKAFGINHSEIFTRTGLSPSVEFPRILGIECVGEIVATNVDSKFMIGQKVISIMGEMGRAFDGSYAEYALLPDKQLYPVNTNLDWEVLAAIPETYSTAFGSIQALKIKETDHILVRGASSGVGLAFQRLLKGKCPQIRIMGSSRNLTKSKKLVQLGFDEIILDNQNILKTEQKFHKILDLVGPVATKNSFKHLEPGGIVCSTGQLGGQWYLEDFDPIIDIPENSYLTSFYSQNVNEKMMNELLDYIKTYRITVKPEKIYTLEEIQEAHTYLESSHTIGKVVVVNKE